MYIEFLFCKKSLLDVVFFFLECFLLCVLCKVILFWNFLFGVCDYCVEVFFKFGWGKMFCI